MNGSPEPILVGVDAGGSKTTAWVVKASEYDPLAPVDASGCGHAGPANIRAIGPDKASLEIRSAIERALTDADVLGGDADSLKICVAAAGAGREPERRQLRDLIVDAYPFANIAVTHDAHPILADASREQIGVALICGTGSFAWGMNQNGDEARCGGWGYLFGDEGSGYWIAIETLRAVAHADDGRGEATQLTGAVCDRLGISSPNGMIGRLYDRSVTRGEVARLSEAVFHCPNDPTASRIIQSAADALALMVLSLAKKLELRGENHLLACSGGLLIHQPLLRKMLGQRIGESFTTIHVVEEPVSGTIRMAARL